MCRRADYLRYHVVGGPTEAADYVYHVSVNLAKAPYVAFNPRETALSLASAQKAPTSVRGQPVWVRMLCCVPGVSEKQAAAVAGRYRNIFELSAELEAPGGEGRVADVRTDGGAAGGGRRVGGACAAKLRTVFTADSGSTRLRGG